MSRSRLNSTKKKAFWPVPGGWKNYLETTYQTLYFIDEVNPSFDQLVDWFLENFDRVKSRKNARGYVNNVIKTCGLVSFTNKKELVLTQDGIVFLHNRDSNQLFETLDSNIVGFSEILLSIRDGNTKLDSIHKKTVEYLEGIVNWTSNYPVKYRLDWLRALGLVNFKNGHYLLINEPSEPRYKVQQKGMTLEISRRPIHVQTQPSKSEVESIIKALTDTEHDSSNPTKYEAAVAEAFEYLGFSAEHLGNPGETDVLVIANVGKDLYTIVVDGKTSKNEKITERQISWATISDHKDQHDADIAIVAAPDFPGGDMIKRSSDFGVSLLKTSILIELLLIHQNTPLNLVDYRYFFSKTGILRISENTDFLKILSTYKKQNELLPKIMFELNELHRLDEKSSITDLYWSLKKEYGKQEIGQSLDLLSNLGFIIKDEKENYLSIVNRETIEKKLTSLTRLFNGNSQ